MSGPLSKERLEEIRARADAATPGPWASVVEAGDGFGSGDDGQVVVYVAGDRYRQGMAFVAGGVFASDAEFIECARTDIPALLDYISYLEAQVAFQAETIRGMAVDEAR